MNVKGVAHRELSSTLAIPFIATGHFSVFKLIVFIWKHSALQLWLRFGGGRFSINLLSGEHLLAEEADTAQQQKEEKLMFHFTWIVLPVCWNCKLVNSFLKHLAH